LRFAKPESVPLGRFIAALAQFFFFFFRGCDSNLLRRMNTRQPRRRSHGFFADVKSPVFMRVREHSQIRARGARNRQR
jgi:hypothetical protein